MGLHSSDSQDFTKGNGSDKTKHVKKINKKCQKKIKTPFWGTFKNRRLDPKVCADQSWLMFSKMVLKCVLA